METKKRTITLTDRRPVTIIEEQWPAVAIGKSSDHDGKVYVQSNRRYSAYIRVRQHADGRSIVYGTVNFSTNYERERDLEAKGGVLLDSTADLVQAIRRVAQTLLDRVHESGCDTLIPHIRTAEVECVADLPAEEI